MLFTLATGKTKLHILDFEVRSVDLSDSLDEEDDELSLEEDSSSLSDFVEMRLFLSGDLWLFRSEEV